jgi:hypothetical protein
MRIVMELNNNDMGQDALPILKQAAEIAPDDVQISEMIQKNGPDINVFATTSGCGKENSIKKAPVTIENLTICIQYKNMGPDSIAKVVMENKNRQSIEIPVVLNGRSGNKPISIRAPIEGFSTGHHSISLMQNGEIISETFIEFESKRR